MDIRYGYCKCGCGEKTRINPESRPGRGWAKGEPRDFLRGHQGRMRTLEESFSSHVDKSGAAGCWLWTGMQGGKGYGRFKFRGKLRPAHRVSWELEHGAIPAGLLVCHHCDIPSCVNPAHLFLGTQKENLADRDRKGRAVYRKGEDNGAAKLNWIEVRDIRDRYIRGEAPRALAEEFGVSPSAVSLIVRGRTWI